MTEDQFNYKMASKNLKRARVLTEKAKRTLEKLIAKEAEVYKAYMTASDNLVCDEDEI
jgi:hypothetical protein